MSGSLRGAAENENVAGAFSRTLLTGNAPLQAWRKHLKRANHCFNDLLMAPRCSEMINYYLLSISVGSPQNHFFTFPSFKATCFLWFD